MSTQMEPVTVTLTITLIIMLTVSTIMRMSIRTRMVSATTTPTTTDRATVTLMIATTPTTTNMFTPAERAMLIPTVTGTTTGTHTDMGIPMTGPNAKSHGHHGRGQTATVELEARIMAKNDALAAKNRAWFAERGILAVNLVSSPGAGKTTLLERTIRDLQPEMPIFVVEGDQATANDGLRIRAAGAPVIQINTGTGCHLEADMIALGLEELEPSRESVVLIENVGNLVCPAMFDLGERAKAVIFSVTEGEDKPLKYPHMFAAAGVLILSKTDLLPHLDFDLDLAVENARTVNPSIEILPLSCRTGEGLDGWYNWLQSAAAASKATAFGKYAEPQPATA